MRVIISRKGFDSSFGGIASPILENGSMMSFPIPGPSPTRYQDIFNPNANTDKILFDLTKGKMTGDMEVHFDPDLNPNNLKRKEGWLGSLGQTGSAQGHLEAQQVQKGDIFLFFGWFREAIFENENYKFKPKSPDIHSIFGYLQIGEILKLGSNPDANKIITEYPWLEGHPHLYGTRDANNTLYIASEQLIIDGHLTKLPGASTFNNFSKDLQLTADNQKSRSLWKTPSWLKPPVDDNDLLTYHGDAKRWSKDESDNNLLQSVAKGQEFVISLKDEVDFNLWFNKLLEKEFKPQIKIKI